MTVKNKLFDKCSAKPSHNLVRSYKLLYNLQYIPAYIQTPLLVISERMNQLLILRTRAVPGLPPLADGKTTLPCCGAAATRRSSLCPALAAAAAASSGGGEARMLRLWRKHMGCWLGKLGISFLVWIMRYIMIYKQMYGSVMITISSHLGSPSDFPFRCDFWNFHPQLHPQVLFQKTPKYRHYIPLPGLVNIQKAIENGHL